MIQESAVLHLTDLHTGKKTDSFDVKVLEQRLTKLTENAILVSNIIKSGYSLRKLYIPITGDAIDGDSIYKTHSFHTDQEGHAAFARAQVNKAADILVPRILSLQDVAEDIEIDGVMGNHGRGGRFAHEGNNYDLMLYDKLKDRFAGHKHINVRVHEKFAGHVDIEGHGFLLYHGAGVKMYQNIPFYGIRQRVMRWRDSLPYPFKVVLMGHFHQCLQDQVGNVRILLGGCCPSGDEWSLENLGVDGINRFHFFGVHHDRPVTWSYQLEME